ncbi:MAG: twin-arginine translocation signal domain-containing protein [Gemmatimonadaceae bacterium]|nr:twin-arginine translocation signal domain-containing protein [Gemmatimonadaceae bacterium]
MRARCDRRIMTFTRRTFLKTGIAAAAATALPTPLLAQLGAAPEPVPPIDDPRLQALAARALDAATSAGATYADVRLTHTRTRRFFPLFTHDEESMEVGVRALVDGYWGFASGPVWSPDEMARLGREAAHEARTNALGGPRVVELAPAPVVRNAHWDMPVVQDPFALSPFECQDFLASLERYLHRHPGAGVQVNAAAATLQAKAFASTLGSWCTQRCYRTEGAFVAAVQSAQSHREGGFSLDCLSAAGMGWELYTAEHIPRVREHSLYDEIDRHLEVAEEELRLPVKPVDVGRYDAVLDAVSMARLVDETLGRATELDRALGYEANAGGTSYITDPLAMIGSYQAGALRLTLTADRSEPGGAATVKWDDEGVAPDTFQIVTDGVLTDFQTTRESAGWMKDYYTKHGIPVRSHGCAAAPSAVYAPLQHNPNLTLAPGHEAQDFDALVKGMSRGIAIKGAGLDMDFQHSSGLGTGGVYEVRNGKRVAQIASAGFLFRATELWKALQAVGGEASLRRYGMAAAKGEPAQRCYHSVTAAPAIVKELTLIDPQRKA